MLKLVRAFVLTLAVIVGAASAAQAEVAVESIGRSVISKIAYAPGFEIKDFFSGYTFKMNSRFSTPAYPFDGPSFVYFSPNGRVAVWRGAGADPKISGGNWEAGWLGNNETLLCMDFDDFKQGGSCVVLESAGTLIQQRVKGNVFGLKVGAAAPMVLRRNQVDFKFVARELGL